MNKFIVKPNYCLVDIINMTKKNKVMVRQLLLAKKYWEEKQADSA